MDLSHFNLRDFIITLTVLICSIALHEFGHAFSADYLGDPTPRREGRVTLWPDKHFDPVGFTMMVITSIAGFGIGWGKPVMVNTRYFKKPGRDMVIVTICGPLMNLFLALLFGIPLRFILAAGVWPHDSIALLYFEAFLQINLSLMFFNLIPVTPLDGSKILYGFLPFGTAVQYERFMGQWGPILFIVLALSGIAGVIISPAVLYSMNLITGVPWTTIGR